MSAYGQPPSGYYGGGYPQSGAYPAQPGYGQPVYNQQPGYGGGYSNGQPQTVYVAQRPPQRSGTSGKDCCLYALIAMCCACCVAEAID